MRISILGGIVLVALATTAQAKVYKWTDAQGKVHYSAHPPAQMKAQEVKVAPPPPSAQAAPAPQVQPAEAKREAQPAPQVATNDQARAEAFRKNCEIARQNLTILEDPANRRFSEDGKQSTYYTDEQRAAKIAEARKSIESFCKEAAKK